MDKKTVVLFNNSSYSSLATTPSKISLTRGLNDSRQNLKPSSVNIVLKSSGNVVERCGLPTPVLVEEAFSFTDRNIIISARIADCGYAWVVCGRNLLIWQFQPSPQNGNSSMQLKFPVCHQLKLPHSDLAHRAELISVFVNKTSPHPSCVAVSPSGMVRYWPDITHGHCSVDENLELNGEECDSLIDAGSLGCILVTTTCTVVLIQYKQGNYGHQLQCRTLKTQGSWLGGISRRVSSIFFGPMSSDHGNETRIIRLLAIPGIQQNYSIYVLAGLNLQKWSLTDQVPEQLRWSADVSRLVKDSFRSHISHWELCDPADIDAWILDMQPDREGVLMLCAAVNQHMAPQVYYGMISFAVNIPNPPTQPRDFLLLKMMGLYTDNNSGEVLNYKFILCANNAYVYSNKSITVIKPQEDPDRLEFLHPSDRIFSGCACSNWPIFFSRQHGLIAITGNEIEATLGFGTSSVIRENSFSEQTQSATNLSVYHLDPIEIFEAHRDTDGQLKAAFIFHAKSQLAEAYDVVNKLFPANAPALPAFDSPLDIAVVKIGNDILDDIPTGDPRWTQKGSSGQGIGSSRSMLVIRQLQDKQQAFNLYINFLKESGLWKKLTGLRIRNSHMATIHVLSELAEKIVASIAMKKLPTSTVYEDTLERAVRTYATPTGDGLSNHDIFFREVTRIHEGFSCLSKICEDSSHSAAEPADVIRVVHDGNSIVLAVLSSVLKYRKLSSDIFSLNDISRNMNLQYCPWTVAAGPEGVMDALMLQHTLTVNYGLKVVGDKEVRQTLLNDFVMLADIILDGRKMHLSTVKSSRYKSLFKQYCTDRNKLIKPLMELNAQEEALMLAEKYLDYEILVTICEGNNDEERLNEYMRRFKDTGFSEFVYSWYMKEGKQAKLLNRYCKSEEHLPEGRERLSRFLTAYPSLSWIQNICDKDFSSASEVLRQLGENETECVMTQKSMYSLSKLAKLAGPDASDSDDHIEDINKKLQLIEFQEQIPDYVLQQQGFDASKPKVLIPWQIVSLYINTHYVDAKELEFRKALDVISFIEDDNERAELTLQVWRAALLRDTWNFPNLDNPLDCLRETLFFKLVDISVYLGFDPIDILPPLDELLDDPSLDDLLQNINFRTLVKTGYEYIRTQMP
ncbi:nuclear pore complex protein Nup133 [Euwallacea similis]|uniref:nuclear pore complex protein Nup133 n=1 Tax=Euwallacea similis TaxID=1736056 RepID=UPI00344F0F44